VRALKYLGCAFGAAVAASILYATGCQLIVGILDVARFTRLLDVSNPIVGVLGAVVGLVLCLLSENNANGR